LTRSWLEEILSSLGAACSIGQSKDGKSVKFDAPSDGTDRTKPTNLNGLSLVMGPGSSWVIPVTRSEQRRVMTFLIERSDKTTQTIV
jgi:hypothetical protein